MKHLVMDSLEVGNQYTAKELAEIWGFKSHHAIIKGIVVENNNNIVVLFVTRDKQTGATPYEDRIEGNVLHMMGQKGHGTDDRIASNLRVKKDLFFLFFRDRHHTPFTYYGRCVLLSALLKRINQASLNF